MENTYGAVDALIPPSNNTTSAFAYLRAYGFVLKLISCYVGNQMAQLRK